MGHRRQSRFVGRWMAGQTAGYRMHSGRLKPVLRQHPRIQDCVVVRSKKLTPGGPQLWAILSRKWSLLADMDMRDFCYERLHDYHDDLLFLSP